MDGGGGFTSVRTLDALHLKCLAWQNYALYVITRERDRKERPNKVELGPIFPS